MIEQTFHTPLPLTLEVSIPSGAIAIETDGAEETAVTVDGDERMLEAVEVRHDGGRVVVSLQNRGRFGISLGSLFGNAGLRVEARVPHGATVRVKTASADTELAGHVGALELNSASGDVRLRGEIAEDATVKTVSGDVELERVDGDLSVQCVSGDVRARAVAGSVDTKSVSGDIRVVRSLGLGLDEKAVEAVAQWRFQPGSSDGKPVVTNAIIEVNFHLL